LIAPEWSDAKAGSIIEEIVGVEVAIAQELPGRAVELVRAGLDHRVDLAAGFITEFGRVVRGLYAEFAQRINDRLDRVGAVLHFFGVEAVDEILVVVGALAVHAERHAARALGVVALHGVVLRGLGGSGHQNHQLREVAAVERQVGDCLGLDHAADLRVRRL
jgi:hypothetical protein